jgi:hypothetical protein
MDDSENKMIARVVAYSFLYNAVLVVATIAAMYFISAWCFFFLCMATEPSFSQKAKK